MPRTYTPLRYPGGKSSLYGYVKNLIEKNDLTQCTYIEPFSGGAGLALSLLYKGVINSIVINDVDTSIYAFWYCALNYSEELCKRIVDMEVNMDEWYKQKEVQKNIENYDLFEIALSTLFLNRTNRSGIIKGGVMGGKSQEGLHKMNCRFNKEDLCHKIEVFASMKDNIIVTNYDARYINYYDYNIICKKTFIYFDPPYVTQGKNLYCSFFNSEDHKELSNVIMNLEIPWILTYDNHPLVEEMYQYFNRSLYELNYTAADKKKGKELMIYSRNIVNGINY